MNFDKKIDMRRFEEFVKNNSPKSRLKRRKSNKQHQNNQKQIDVESTNAKKFPIVKAVLARNSYPSLSESFEREINKDIAFIDEPKEQKPPEYELNENDLLKKLRGENFPIRIKKCNDYYVGDGIGNNYERWEIEKPVFISAQTGRGKNTFIENVLIPYIKDLNYRENTKNKMLILSNRIALNTQIKNRIEKSGVAKVLLYQGFLDYLNFHKNLDKYKYVICDECHFFTSDAMFNPNTALILEKIIMNFQHAVRIYMSSTFNDCLPYIFGFEKDKHRLSVIPEIIFTTADISNIRVAMEK